MYWFKNDSLHEYIYILCLISYPWDVLFLGIRVLVDGNQIQYFANDEVGHYIGLHL